MPHIGRLGIPVIKISLGRGQRLPVFVAVENLAVNIGEHLGMDVLTDHLVDFQPRGPDILQVDWLAVLTHAQWLVQQVDIHAAGQSVRHYQRR